MEEQKTQISSELEALCAPLPAAAERAGKALEERYYVSLAQAAMEPEDSPTRLGPKALALESEVQAELEGVRQVSRTLVQTYQTLDSAADELSARLRDMRTARERKWYVPNPPANSAIDLAEARRDHFAQGLNIYKVLLICAAGSFAGVVVEMLWCLITNGYLESRAGLVYGPFNLLYGAGAVCLTLALYKYRNRGYQWSFLGGFAVGSVVEYGCSWVQEALFGSRSWDYSNMPLNLNGRICVTYSLFWGLLGVLWIKDLYPRLAKWILKIPNKVGKPVTWVLTAFLLFNGVVSCIAVSRWPARLAGEPPANPFWAFVDERFPNERMESIFINMKFTP